MITDQPGSLYFPLLPAKEEGDYQIPPPLAPEEEGVRGWRFWMQTLTSAPQSLNLIPPPCLQGGGLGWGVLS
jgi:hypothetical protein